MSKNVNKICCLFVSLTVLATESLSQGFAAPRSLESFNQEWQERERARLGKTYTIMFGRGLCSSIGPALRILESPHMEDTRAYSSRSPVTLVLDSIVPEIKYGVYRYYKFALADGNSGYLNTLHFSPVTKTDEWTLRNDCLFEGTSDEVTARVQEFDQAKRRETEQAEAERTLEIAKREEIRQRPGARIGMTAKEVVEKTSWGVPDSVNKTISQSGAAEQWVYGDRQYQYFKNGRLVSIQTSR